MTWANCDDDYDDCDDYDLYDYDDYNDYDEYVDYYDYDDDNVERYLRVPDVHPAKREELFVFLFVVLDVV